MKQLLEIGRHRPVLHDKQAARVAVVVERGRACPADAPARDRYVVLAFADPACSASLDAHARPSSLARFPHGILVAE
jgi:hypothetical protein